jgi:hypothetical protein
MQDDGSPARTDTEVLVHLHDECDEAQVRIYVTQIFRHGPERPVARRAVASSSRSMSDEVSTHSLSAK